MKNKSEGYSNLSSEVLELFNLSSGIEVSEDG